MVGPVPLPVKRIGLFQLKSSDGGVSTPTKLPVERICLFQL